MKYEGILGPVTKAPHAGWIELQSVQWGAELPFEMLTLNFTKVTFTQPAPPKDQKHAAQLIEFHNIQQRMS